MLARLHDGGTVTTIEVAAYPRQPSLIVRFDHAREYVVNDPGFPYWDGVAYMDYFVPTTITQMPPALSVP